MVYKFKAKIWHKIPKKICENATEKYKHLKDDYYMVYFFDDIEEMYSFYDKKFGKYNPTEHNYNGLCKYDSRIFMYEDGTEKFCKNCGVILYYIDEFGTNTLTHEVAHAITFYFTYRINHQDKLQLFNRKDLLYNELFSYMSGHLASQINTKYYELLENKQKEQE